MAKTSRRPLPRGTLDRKMIVDASLRLLAKKGTRGFSMPALGRELGADPSAVYRHFASKEELILAISDELIARSEIPSLRRGCWIETLAAFARRVWALGAEQPAAMTLIASRIAAMPGTFGAMNFGLGLLREGGYDGPQSARLYRSFIDSVLGITQQRSALLDLGPSAWELDKENEARVRLADPEQYPHLAAAADTMAGLDWDDAFELALSLILASIEAHAPSPCGHQHDLRSIP